MMADTSPLAILEAMGAGKPVIASNVGDIPRIITDGKTGCWFLTRIHDVCRQFSFEARKKIEEGHTRERVAEKTLVLYEEILTKANNEG